MIVLVTYLSECKDVHQLDGVDKFAALFQNKVAEQKQTTAKLQKAIEAKKRVFEKNAKATAKLTAKLAKQDQKVRKAAEKTFKNDVERAAKKAQHERRAEHVTIEARYQKKKAQHIQLEEAHKVVALNGAKTKSPMPQIED